MLAHKAVKCQRWSNWEELNCVSLMGVIDFIVKCVVKTHNQGLSQLFLTVFWDSSLEPYLSLFPPRALEGCRVSSTNPLN